MVEVRVDANVDGLTDERTDKRTENRIPISRLAKSRRGKNKEINRLLRSEATRIPDRFNGQATLCSHAEPVSLSNHTFSGQV